MGSGKPPLPILTVTFANLALAGGGVGLWYWHGKDWFPCLSTYAGIGLFGLVGPVLLHVVWRFLVSPFLWGVVNSATSISVPFVTISLQPQRLIRFLDNINLKKHLPPVALLVLGLIALVTSPLFVFLPEPRQEDPPIVQAFLVQDLSTEAPVSYHPGQAVQVKGQILVEAKIIGACALPCEWQAAKGGLIPAKACSVVYTPSVVGGMDSLTVLVRSPCKTLETFSTLFITP